MCTNNEIFIRSGCKKRYSIVCGLLGFRGFGGVGVVVLLLPLPPLVGDGVVSRGLPIRKEKLSGDLCDMANRSANRR